MPTKKQPNNDVVLLIADKEELKATIEARIQIGLKICERQINSQQEQKQMWADFIDWNNLNEEVIRQAFDKPKNFYVEEYKYKAGIDLLSFYGEQRRKTFQEEVDGDKAAIKYQIRKLKWFSEKIDFLQSDTKAEKIDKTGNDFNSLILLLNRFHKVAQAIREV
jgi:hypothetical protein